MNTNLRWNNFLKELANLIFFWFFGVLFFTIFRISFILIFRKQVNHPIDFIEIYDVLLMGFRFDCTAVAYFLLIPFVSLLLLSSFDKFEIIKMIRKIHQFLFVILSTFICIITINYFKEYHDQFNNFIFLALYDDQKAVLKTIIKDFNPLLNSFLIIITIIGSFLILKQFEKKETIATTLQKINFKKSNYAIVAFSIVFFFAGIRGSFSSIPALRQYSGVSNDAFLNKTIINPYRSLKYAIQDFNKVNLLDGKNPFMNEKQFKATFSQNNITDVLIKKAKGPTIEKPKQLFLIVMESYDSWPLMEKYLPFHLSDNLNAIAKKGTHFTHFLPSGSTTIDSFGAIMTNVPNCGVNLSHVGTVNEPFQTSIFNQFKKLGYQTNLYYGGFLSWENIGELSKYQGVDRIFSAADAGGETESGDWGIEDEKLFDMVNKNTDTQKYSLNIILTTSYHAPYSIDVQSKGFPYQSKEDFPQSMKKYYDDAMTVNELGHLWYSDKAIGDFVKKAETNFSESLFCFTGDHFGRKFINNKPNLYEKSSVAFIMYGKSIPKSVNTTPGSHIDIMPTLIEMIAPKDFEYYSFGKSMFEKGKRNAIGYNKLIQDNEMYYFPKEANVEKINLTNFKEQTLKKSDLIKKHNELMALAWHYTVNGNSLKTKKLAFKK